jgi:hypothetical protein
MRLPVPISRISQAPEAPPDDLVKASLFRLRGIAQSRVCPACGGDTMRSDGGLLARLLRLAGLRQRWCRRCLRQWITRKLPPRRSETTRRE